MQQVYQLAFNPLMINLETGARRLGIFSRADTSPAVKRYIFDKIDKLANALAVQAPPNAVFCNGHRTIAVDRAPAKA